MFKIGQKVVCVIDGTIRDGGFSDRRPKPRKGSTYVVSGTATEEGVCGGYGVLIDGLPNYGRGQYAATDFGWHSYRFRPLISQADDIAMFQKLVDTMKPTERLDVLREMLDDA